MREVAGVGRSAENLSAALGMYVIDAPFVDAAAAVQDADVVMLAVPVGRMGQIMQTIAPKLAPHTIVTDVGSTKQSVIALARQHLAAHLPRFVPGHPIAGAEKSGVKAARGDLFKTRNVVLTPIAETEPAAVESVAALWRGLGAQVSQMPATLHDEVFAAVSHLPHVLAFALVDYIAQQSNAEQLFGFAAGGFRDFTRIAGSSPEMWRDICVANREAVAAQIGAFEQVLGHIRLLVENSDGAALQQLFSRARDTRQKYLAS